MTLPLVVNTIRSDGPHEALGNSFGKVRNNGTRWHKGWDLSAEPNSPVFAVADGTVVQVYANVSGFGRCILLELKNPKYKPGLNASIGIENYEKLYALYAHLSHVEVSKGDSVSETDRIGKTGMSGNAVGEPAHLHFELLLENSLATNAPRIDPGELLGYELYTCGGSGLVNQKVFGSLKGN
ncbi:M23 family metallopeptidase [Paraburkholderia sp. UYCP14C]|uniref:M23 family metallopeptidase n=1 Tax=Paraburkholderia sp. UYCP14C TaxID=2511130 RepID=UPI00101EAF8B|nr:M23 family metallopeptidase [Paraburkholderia sp. UYCP14C]RZF27280.1 M23 family metallopeptidase [Paraburkholderia sp. UYCP14C]